MPLYPSIPGPTECVQKSRATPYQNCRAKKKGEGEVCVGQVNIYIYMYVYIYIYMYIEIEGHSIIELGEGGGREAD